jgi:hypothetical protein
MSSRNDPDLIYLPGAGDATQFPSYTTRRTDDYLGAKPDIVFAEINKTVQSQTSESNTSRDSGEA